MVIEEAHGAAAREPLLNNMQHLRILHSDGHGQVPDKQIQELRPPSRAEVGVAQPVVVADVLLDLGGEVAAQGEHVLYRAGGGQLVQQESAKKSLSDILNRRRVRDPNKSVIFFMYLWPTYYT